MENQRKPFLKIDKEIFESSAFKSLSGSALKTYLTINSEHYEYNDKTTKRTGKRDNWNNIIISYTKISQYVSRGMINPSLKELVKKGLLEIKQRGKFRQLPNIYKLSDKWRNYKQEKVKRIQNKNLNVGSVVELE